MTTRKYRPDTNAIKTRRKMSETPGPGTYRLPSDFGYLELKKFVNTDAPSTRNYRNNSLGAGEHHSIGGVSDNN